MKKPRASRRSADRPAFALLRLPMTVVLAAIAAVAAATSAVAQTADPMRECQADAMLVFDASGSMGTTDYALKKPRIARVKDSMRRIIPEVAPVRRLGLMVYGEGEYNDCQSIDLRLPPTANAQDQLLAAIQGINPRGRTPLTESVRMAAEVLDYANRESVVVLLTDGEETCGGDPCKMAQALKAKGPKLTVHVIGYREGQPGYFAARCMADLTGGSYFSVSTEDELVEALRKTLGCPFVTDEGTSFGRRRLAALSAAPARQCRLRTPAP